MRMVDIDLGVMPTDLPIDEVRPANREFFKATEPIRLWLKERKLEAPFRKLGIRVHDEALGIGISAGVMNAFSVCGVGLYFPLSILKRAHRDRAWSFEVILKALEHVHEKLKWRSKELEAYVVEVSKAGLPFTHDFSKFTKLDRKTKTTCVVWMRFKDE